MVVVSKVIFGVIQGSMVHFLYIEGSAGDLWNWSSSHV